MTAAWVSAFWFDNWSFQPCWSRILLLLKIASKTGIQISHGEPGPLPRPHAQDGSKLNLMSFKNGILLNSPAPFLETVSQQLSCPIFRVSCNQEANRRHPLDSCIIKT